jgi:S-adenosylmethionine hydrolase
MTRTVIFGGRPALVACITLTTDFSVRDWFVGTMKGVILRLAPKASIIDLTHDIPPGDIRAGAFALAVSYAFFPRHTVHMAVVDPGVGSPRRAIAIRTSDYFFIGPDNGLLSWALAKEKIKAIHALENQSYFLPKVSCTFHGRDVFAPVAAHLSRGLPIHKLGARLTDFIRLDWPEPKQSPHEIQGEILYIDRFGNGITNISSSALKGLQGAPVILLKPKRIPIAQFYQAIPPDKPVALVGSTGFLEIAINGGNAAKSLGLRVGMAVKVRGLPRRL